MNVIEIKKLNEVVNLLDKVLDGKVENLPEAKEARNILYDLIEFKDISNQAWKFALEE